MIDLHVSCSINTSTELLMSYSHLNQVDLFCYFFSYGFEHRNCKRRKHLPKRVNKVKTKIKNKEKDMKLKLNKGKENPNEDPSLFLLPSQQSSFLFFLNNPRN